MSGIKKPLIIHSRAAKDARVIAAMYAEVSDELHIKFWKEIDDAIDYIKQYPRGIITTQAEEEGAISSAFHTIYDLRNA